VIRGDDHLNNTPKQIPLFAAFGYDLPAFAHVPMILGADGAKLSKRHGATSITEYQAMGLLPSAVRLALARLSWTPKIDGKAVESAEEELLTDAQMIQLFDLADCQKSAARFDMDKLQWINQKLIQRASWEALEPHLRPFVPEMWDEKPAAWKAQAIQATQKGKSLTDMAEALRFAFERPADFDDKAVAKFLTKENEPHLRALRAVVADVTPFDQASLEAVVNAWLEKTGLLMKNVAQPARVALTGRTQSPGLFEVMDVLGKERTLARLDAGATKAAG
jgi:glutamyl-tRNA synthetase